MTQATTLVSLTIISLVYSLIHSLIIYGNIKIKNTRQIYNQLSNQIQSVNDLFSNTSGKLNIENFKKILNAIKYEELLNIINNNCIVMILFFLYILFALVILLTVGINSINMVNIMLAAIPPIGPTFLAVLDHKINALEQNITE